MFEIIAEPNRRAILSLLVSSEQSVGEIERQLGMAQPTVSKHLRVLREAGFVESTVDAQRRLYRLKPEPLQEIEAWLAPFRRFWSAHLDALERHLDRMDPPTRTKGRRRQGEGSDRSRAVRTGAGQRGAGTKGRREVDAHSRQRTAPLAGKSLAGAHRPGASARVGAIRCRWEPGYGWTHGEAHHGGSAHAAGFRNQSDASRRSQGARVQLGRLRISGGNSKRLVAARA